MLTEEEIREMDIRELEAFRELDEEEQQLLLVIHAKARAFKPSEDHLRMNKLIDTDPAAAAREIMERARRRNEEERPQRELILRRLRQQQEEEDAAAAARGIAGADGSGHGERGGDADRPAKRVKRQCPVAPPDMIPKISSVSEDAGKGWPVCV